ncbi:UvrD-helicase domain-containing protein [Fredinandcohnia sp. QZ13]|uniref:UvrD-helicase domain-containing protein n=1 Tax=Fredinandcohnia sp. QZ13 TaxID=3073144 RepID=UPI002852F9DB|nr:UvrD-helicase domain-containing protein [Fredinandcohnia sp. QZ13]MDR4886868.1 UvrD-helicase domain-containing protein [Fredinandcohnia sp. QZ13]
MTKVIVDQEARDKISTVLNQNFLVEAGAGSGKTTSLVDRMVNLIYTGTAKMDEIVAITFTKKAADELKTRFLTVLEKKSKVETDLDVKFLLEDALQNIEQSFIGTVHSFCARLLRERPVEAGIGVHFSELEDTEDDKIAKAAWLVYTHKLEQDHPRKSRIMKDLGLREKDLMERFCQMKNYPDVEWASEVIEKPNLDDVFRRFITLLKEASRCIPKEIPKGPDSLQEAIDDALRHVKYDDKTDALKIKIFQLFDKKLKVTQYKWTSKEDAKEYHARITDFFEEHIQPLLVSWSEYCHPFVIELFQEAFAEYEIIKQERSLMNFQDLLMRTAALLRDNAEVRSYFQGKYKRLLVDEFQDTDPIQAEIMFYLTGEDVTEQNWTKCKPRPGSLFVVGDPKQAIYRFRRADIDIYNLVKELIEAHGGEVLQLIMNFRTVDNVTSLLNEVFQEHLPEEETVHQAAYRPLFSYKEGSKTDFSGIKRLVLADEIAKNKAITVEEDANSITAYVQKLIKEGHEPREFMILTRQKDGIDVYASKLEEAGIPVSVSGEMEIGTILEFQDLICLLEALVDPNDQIALVAALRSIWFGISDEELFQWGQAGGVFSIFAPSPDHLNSDTKQHIEGALSKLKQYVKWKTSHSPVVTIKKIMEDIGLYPLFLIKGYGKREATNLLQILEALRVKEEDEATTFSQAVDYVKQQIEEKTKVINLEEDENAVRIMNVHKAKGLEAPIVFLAHPGKKPEARNKIWSHIRREEQSSTGYFMFERKQGFARKPVAQPLYWESYLDAEEAYLLAEEIRILYVAATRAEKAMIISSFEAKNDKNPWNLLLDGISGLEEIEKLEPTHEEKEIQRRIITRQEFVEDTQGLLDWIDDRKQPSFSTYSPTEDKQDIFTLEIEREEGGGQTWGTAIHEVFEKIAKGEEAEELIVSTLQKHEISLGRRDEVAEAVAHFKQSMIWAELQIADHVLTEVPFMMKIDAQDPLYELVEKGDNAETVYASGIIDLAYKLNGTWKIVDYKTDRPKDIAKLPVLAKYYQNQIDLYQQIWERITGEKVADKQLYFVTPNIIVGV